MLKQRLEAARRIANELTPTEAHIDSALGCTSRLVSAIVEGRATTGVSISLGQESLAQLSGVMAALVEARAKVIAAHVALAQDRIDAGLSAYGMGDVSDCPATGAALTVVQKDARTAA